MGKPRPRFVQHPPAKNLEGLPARNQMGRRFWPPPAQKRHCAMPRDSLPFGHAASFSNSSITGKHPLKPILLSFSYLSTIFISACVSSLPRNFVSTCVFIFQRILADCHRGQILHMFASKVMDNFQNTQHLNRTSEIVVRMTLILKCFRR